jgi:site-specific DNA recombinase
MFRLAQEQLRHNLEKSRRNQKYRYLLSSHVKCGRHYAGYPNGHGTLFYRCPGRSRIVSIIPCSGKLIKTDDLDSLVWNEVKKVLTPPEVVLTELHRRKEDSNNRYALHDEMNVVDRSLERIDKC